MLSFPFRFFLKSTLLSALVLCLLSLSAKASEAPPLIPTDALVENYQRDPIVFVHGIMGSRLIKKTDRGDEYVAFVSLPSLLGRNYADLLLDPELNFDTGDLQLEGKDEKLYDRLLELVATYGAVSQQDHARPVARMELLDRVEIFFDSPELARLSRKIQKHPLNREGIPKLTRLLRQSQFPGLQETGDISEWLSSLPVFDLFMKRGLLSGLDHLLRPGISVQDSLIQEFLNMGYLDQEALDESHLSGSPLLYEFTYDWRQNNFVSALALRNFIESKPGLRGKKVRIVSHSMGNVVTLLYMNALGGHQRVHHLALLAPALRGSPAALWYLFRGHPSLDPFYRTPEVREIMFWSPAVWQLLPRDELSLIVRTKPDDPSSDIFVKNFADSAASYSIIKKYVTLLSKRLNESAAQLQQRLAFAKLTIHTNELIHKILEEDPLTLCEIEAKRLAFQKQVSIDDVRKQAQINCAQATERLAKIPQLKVIAKNTFEASTLSHLVLDLQNNQIVQQVYNNLGDGTLPFYGTLTRLQLEQYVRWNNHYRRDRDRFHYSARTLRDNFPGPLVVFQPFADWLLTPLENMFGGPPGALDFMGTFLPAGVRFDHRLTLKIVPSANHVSLLSHPETFRALRFSIRDDLLLEANKALPKAQIFEPLTFLGDGFGAVKIFFRTYGPFASQCRDFVRQAFLEAREQFLLNSVCGEHECSSMQQYLKQLETFNRFSVYSMYCGPSSQSRDKIRYTLWMHDYPIHLDLLKRGWRHPEDPMLTLRLQDTHAPKNMPSLTWFLQAGIERAHRVNFSTIYPMHLGPLYPGKKSNQKPVIQPFP